MQRISVFLMILSFNLAAQAQNHINQSLKRELDSIYIEDQKYRELLFSDLLKTKADSVAASYRVPKTDLLNFLMKQMQATDSSNLVRIQQIIQQYSYPGLSLVGSPSNEAAFYVIQHSPKIDAYLPVIRKAAEARELPFHLYAMMLDRSLMYKGEEQIYGTQGKGIEVVSKQTGKKEFKMIIWPVKDVENVNKRRREAGFESTIEENAKRLGIDYKVMTLQEVNQLTSN